MWILQTNAAAVPVGAVMTIQFRLSKNAVSALITRDFPVPAILPIYIISCSGFSVEARKALSCSVFSQKSVTVLSIIFCSVSTFALNFAVK